MILALLLTALLLGPSQAQIQKTPASDAFLSAVRAVSSFEGADVGFEPRFYVSQRGSGPYEEVNCMPAASAMLLRWALDGRDDGWPGDGWPGDGWPGDGWPGDGWPGDGWPDARTLRALVPLRGAPWRPQQVQEVLTRAGLHVETPEISLDAMTGALRAGRALLVLVQENGLGHCYIVAAYASAPGGETVFEVIDPADGRARLLDADALLARMEGYWWRFLSVSRSPEARSSEG